MTKFQVLPYQVFVKSPVGEQKNEENPKIVNVRVVLLDAYMNANCLTFDSKRHPTSDYLSFGNYST